MLKQFFTISYSCIQNVLLRPPSINSFPPKNTCCCKSTKLFNPFPPCNIFLFFKLLPFCASLFCLPSFKTIFEENSSTSPHYTMRSFFHFPMCCTLGALSCQNQCFILTMASTFRRFIFAGIFIFLFFFLPLKKKFSAFFLQKLGSKTEWNENFKKQYFVMEENQQNFLKAVH